MIAAGIFTIAGIVAWQNACAPGEYTDEQKGFFVLLALICWVTATLCGAGVIS